MNCKGHNKIILGHFYVGQNSLSIGDDSKKGGETRKMIDLDTTIFDVTGQRSVL